MAQLIVRNLEDDIREKLRALARSHGHSMEEEVRDILRGAVVERSSPQPQLGSRLAKRFAVCKLKEEIPELRGHAIEPPGFER